MRIKSMRLNRHGDTAEAIIPIDGGRTAQQ